MRDPGGVTTVHEPSPADGRHGTGKPVAASATSLSTTRARTVDVLGGTATGMAGFIVAGWLIPICFTC